MDVELKQLMLELLNVDFIENTKIIKQMITSLIVTAILFGMFAMLSFIYLIIQFWLLTKALNEFENHYEIVLRNNVLLKENRRAEFFEDEQQYEDFLQLTSDYERARKNLFK